MSGDKSEHDRKTRVLSFFYRDIQLLLVDQAEQFVYFLIGFPYFARQLQVSVQERTDRVFYHAGKDPAGAETLYL